MAFYKKCLVKLNCELTFVDAFAEFEKILLSNSTDLILLDLELDETDAITVIKEIKSLRLKNNPLIIVCSNKADEFIEISALNSGADEFISLPLNALIFESKIKSLFKYISPSINTIPNEGIYIDHEQYKIFVGDKSFTLPRLEFNLLTLLFSHPNKIFSKDEIAAEIWHNKDISTKRTIDIHIRNIRKKLGDNIIKTYRGLGYSLRLNN